MDELKFNTKRTWAEIDLNAVRDNYMAIRSAERIISPSLVWMRHST